MKFPTCEDRAVCRTNPDIGGLVVPSDCIECKKKQAKLRKTEIVK